MRSAVSRSTATGFSTNIGTPASITASSAGPCAKGGTQTYTASGPAASSSATSAVDPRAVLRGQRGRRLRCHVGHTDQLDVVEPGQHPRMALCHPAGPDESHPAVRIRQPLSRTFPLRMGAVPPGVRNQTFITGNATVSPL